MDKSRIIRLQLPYRKKDAISYLPLFFVDLYFSTRHFDVPDPLLRNFDVVQLAFSHYMP